MFLVMGNMKNKNRAKHFSALHFKPNWQNAYKKKKIKSELLI